MAGRLPERPLGRLQGKTAIVTAAAQGMGKAAALAFAAEGAQVIATDVNEGLLADLQGLTGISPRRLDVCDPVAIATFAAETPAPSILFNCAGYVHAGTILECDEAAFDFSVTLNVRSMYRMIRAFLPRMLDAGGGAIINMASVASSIIGAPNRFIYGTTKAAVVGLTKAVAADYVTRGIRVNAICPGTVDSPSLHDRMRALGDYDVARAAFIARQPMGRLGTAEEIAALAVYLASDEAGFMTGQAIAVDGGWSNT
jgi:2-keto-3-deoxy-L-fuconate dehydrogenase